MPTPCRSHAVRRPPPQRSAHRSGLNQLAPAQAMYGRRARWLQSRERSNRRDANTRPSRLRVSYDDGGGELDAHRMLFAAHLDRLEADCAFARDDRDAHAGLHADLIEKAEQLGDLVL